MPPSLRSIRRSLPRALAYLWLCLLLLLILTGQLSRSSLAPEGWAWISCDVGQGDAHLVRSGPDRAYLIDSGQEAQKLEDCLKWAGVRELEAIFITHAHRDHYGALIELLDSEGLIGSYQGPLYLSPHFLGQLPAAEARILEAHPGIKLELLGVEGRQLAAGQGAKEFTLQEQGRPPRLRLLWPPLDSPSLPGQVGSSSWINNSSLVIHWTLPLSGGGWLTVLSTGDLEEEGAGRLIAAGQNLEAQVLKVPHHGSATGGQEIILASKAQLALIPVGAANSFGHPHQEILQALQQQKVPVCRTDQGGHLALYQTEKGVALKGSRGGQTCTNG